MIHTNNVLISGVLAKKDKMWEGETGGRNIRFTIVTREEFKNRDGQMESREVLVPCNSFGETASTVNAAGEGQEIAIRGKFENQKYETDDGEVRSWKGVTVFSVTLGD